MDLRRDKDPGVYKIWAKLEYSEQCLKDLQRREGIYRHKAKELLELHDQEFLDLFDDGSLEIEQRRVNPILLSHKYIHEKELNTTEFYVVGLYMNWELTYWINLICKEVEKCCRFNPENQSKVIKVAERKYDIS